MRNGKTLFLFILAFIVIAIIFVGEINFHSIATDSGFDVGYSGGGSSGGSSGGSFGGSSSHGSSGDFSLLSVLQTIVFLIIFFVFAFILGYINDQLSKIHILNRVAFFFGFLFIFAFVSFFMISLGIVMFFIPNLIIRILAVLTVVVCYVLLVIYIFKNLYKSYREDIRLEKEEAKASRIIKKLKKKALSTTESNKEVLGLGYQIYLDVQTSWMNFDYDTLRTLVTDELFNMYQTQLAPMEVKEQQNIMSDFKLQEIVLVSSSIENNIITTEILLTVSFFDYIVNKNKKVIRGNKNRKVVMTYLLTFVSNGREIEKCPHCGAQLEKGSTICAYCKTTIQSANQMKLAKKEALRQTIE